MLSRPTLDFGSKTLRTSREPPSFQNGEDSEPSASFEDQDEEGGDSSGEAQKASNYRINDLPKVHLFLNTLQLIYELHW